MYEITPLNLKALLSPAQLPSAASSQCRVQRLRRSLSSVSQTAQPPDQGHARVDITVKGITEPVQLLSS